jgi:poly(3-hydroxyalkanoate) depolymerase
MRVVDVGGHSIRVAIRSGRDGGPPLLLCSGIGAGFEVLQPFVDALDPDIEVVRFDVPGVGASPPRAIPYRFPILARMTARLVQRLGATQVDVLGLSWGGALAQQLAFQYPRLVRRLVLAATGTGALMVPGRPRVLARMLTPRRFRDPTYASSIVGSLYGGSTRSHPEGTLGLLGDAMRFGSRTGYTHQLLAGVGWSSLPWLRLIRQPTLVLAGDDDPIVPTVNARILHHLLPHSRLHIYHGGHVALVTEAPALAPVVAAFVRGEPFTTTGGGLWPSGPLQ